MGVRSVRVCDQTTEDVQCNRPYVFACVICGRDTCLVHANSDATITIKIFVGDTIIDFTDYGRICSACLRNRGTSYNPTLAAAVFDDSTREKTIKGIQAAIAAEALKDRK